MELLDSLKSDKLFDYDTLASKEETQVKFTVGLMVFWASLYTMINFSLSFKTLKKKDEDDVKNRVISIIHGILSFWLASWEYLPIPTYNEPNTNFQTFIILMSITYCAYDLAACTYYNLADKGLIIHHIFCILGFGFGILSGYGAIDGIGGLFVAEISNFWMHCRVILRIFDRKHTKLYELLENIYLVLYILFRAILGPFILWYPCVSSPNSPIIVKLMCTCITLQSIYFVVQMITIVKKKQKKYSEMKKKKIELKWIDENPEELKELSFYKKKESTTIF